MYSGGSKEIIEKETGIIMVKLLKNKKFYVVFLSLVALCAMGVFAITNNSSKKADACFKREVEINILHTNDIHADVENLAYVSQYKLETDNAIWLDAGDAIQGQPIATYTKGKAIVEMLNAAKVNVAALGNHEFDYGTEQLLQNVRDAKYTYVAANIRKEDGTAFLKRGKKNGEYKIIRKKGRKIGVFGITTTETGYKTHPNNVKGLVFENEVERAQKVIDILKSKKCDLIVCLAHVGDDIGSNPTSLQMGEQLVGCDLIIDGHSHTEIQQTLSNGTVVVQTGTQLSKLGVVNVKFNKDGKVITPKLLTPEEYQLYGKDVKVIRVHNKYTEQLQPILNTVVGKTNTDLIANEVLEDGSSVRICRQRETSMGDLVADSCVWYADNALESTEYKNLPVVAFANGGGVRANIPAGDITIGQVYNVLPFGNTLSVKIITPDVLYKALEFGISGLSLDENGKVTGLVGSYPQVSGMRFEMDLTKTAYAEGVTDGERITAVYLVNQDGTETKLERTDATTQIAFASNDFLIAGGDGFTMLTNLKHILVGNVLDEVLGDYITKLTEDNGGSFTYEMPGNRSVEINQKQAQ